MALIHQGDKAVAKLHLHRFHRQQGVYVVDVLIVIVLAGGGQLGGELRRLNRRLCLRLALGVHLADEDKPAAQKGRAADEQRNGGRTGDERQNHQDHAGSHDGAGLGLELPHHVHVQAAVGHGTGDNHARGGGAHQGGYLGHQSVADGEDTIGAHDLPNVAAAVDESDGDAAHQVDNRDDDGHSGVALDDFGGAVHSAVKIGLLLNLLPAHPCLLLVNKAGGQIGVNGHLLTGHGVQGKPSGHLGHAFSALGDDDKLHQHDDEEDDEAYHKIAARNQLAKVLNHHTGITGGENHSGTGHVHAQAEQSGNEQ